MIGIMAKLLSVANWNPRKQHKWQTRSFRWEQLAHQTIILTSQKLNPQPIPSSYHIIKVGEIKCVTTKLGEYLNIMPQESTMPIIQNQLLKQLLIEVSHRSYLRMPKARGNINIEIHHNGLVTENKLKRAPLSVFIPDAYHLVNKLISKCSRCNSAKGRP